MTRDLILIDELVHFCSGILSGVAGWKGSFLEGKETAELGISDRQEGGKVGPSLAIHGAAL